MTSAPVEVLEMLREYYPFDVPPPRADLAARIDAGIVGMQLGTVSDGDELAERRRRRTGLALPATAGRRLHVRTAVAALVAAVVVAVGLGAAGALPASLQRPVASAFAHLGIDFPTPANPHHGSQPELPSSSTGTPTIGTSGASGSSSGSGSSPTSPSSGGTATTLGSSAGGSAPTTTVPGSPPPSGPGVTVPPVAVPSPTLPPVTVPQPTLPPVDAPASSGAPIPSNSGTTAPPLPLPPLPVSLSMSSS